MRRVICIFMMFAVPLVSLASEGAASISGRVTDIHETVISGVSIVLKGGILNEEKTVRSSRDGKYMVPELPAGDYKVSVSKFRYETIEEDISLKRGENLVLDFEMESADYGSLSGNISDAEGEPLSGVSVTMSFNDENFSQTRISDYGGDYFIEDLAPGKYEMTAVLEGYLAIKKTIVIGSGEDTELDLMLEAE